MKIKYLSAENLSSGSLMFQLWQSSTSQLVEKSAKESQTQEQKKKNPFIFISQEQTENNNPPIFFFPCEMFTWSK